MKTYNCDKPRIVYSSAIEIWQPNRGTAKSVRGGLFAIKDIGTQFDDLVDDHDREWPWPCAIDTTLITVTAHLLTKMQGRSFRSEAPLFTRKYIAAEHIGTGEEIVRWAAREAEQSEAPDQREWCKKVKANISSKVRKLDDIVYYRSGWNVLKPGEFVFNPHTLQVLAHVTEKGFTRTTNLINFRTGRLEANPK